MTDPDSAPRYAAFISYSHADEAHAGWLHRALEGFRPPKGVAVGAAPLPRRDKLAPIFRDREELASGADLPTLITDALKASGALIVICSPRAAASHWVNQEIRAFREMHGDDRIYALIVDGDPAGENSCFPEALTEKIGADGAVLPEKREPLAADIRPDKDGKTLAKLKLAAGLMNVGLDDLARREDARARKRLVAVAGGSLAAAAFAIALAAFALVQRQEAIEQRARAETEAMTATRTAEFMIDLFEIADPGEAGGREVTAIEILEKGVASIETGLDGEPAVQAGLMQTMGRVHTGLGLYPEAERLLRNARERAAAAGVDPAELRKTDNALARALYEKGDYEVAAPEYDALVADLETRADAPSTLLASALTGQGNVMRDNDALDEAEAAYLRGKKILEDAGETNSEEYIRNLMELGLNLVYLDRYEEANELLFKALEIGKRLKGEKHFLIGHIENLLGTSFYFSGDLSAAKQHFITDLEISRIHLKPDHPELASGANNLGRVAYETGELSLAMQLMEEAVSIQRRTGRSEHPNFAFFLYTYGALLIENGEYERARTELRRATDMIAVGTERMLAPLQLEEGKALCADGEIEGGTALIRLGRERLSEHYSEQDWRYGVADEFESYCAHSGGDRASARDLAQRGYKHLRAARGDEHYFTRRAKAWVDEIS